MKQNTLFILWGGLFILCAGCGFIPEPVGAVRALLTALSIAFFIPPALLLHAAGKAQDTHTAKLVRNLAALSLVLTLILLVCNFLSAFASETVGLVLYYALSVISSPMICGGYWVLSLFLWACLLMGSLKLLRKK